MKIIKKSTICFLVVLALTSTCISSLWAQDSGLSGQDASAEENDSGSSSNGDFWIVTTPEWTTSSEARYSEFVARIGEAVAQHRCRYLQDCLNNPSINPYRRTSSRDLSVFTDCGRLPYALRAYFAWKNGLPFSHVSRVAPNGSSNDIRYTSDGNRVVSRSFFQDAFTPRGMSGQTLLNLVMGSVRSSNYRMDPRPKPNSLSTEDGGISDAGTGTPIFEDFYPAQVNRQGIRPGTVLYDPNGHIIVVYRITSDGDVLYVDGHTSGGLNTGQFGKKFVMSRWAHGAGFKNFYPLRWNGRAIVQAQTGTALGAAYGFSQYLAGRTDMIPVQGDTSHAITYWTSNVFSRQGQTVDFYQWLPYTLSGGNLRIHPVRAIHNLMTGLCTDLQERAEDIQRAVAAHTDRSEHPSNLPLNIYGSDGLWETYSTPSRDARIKVSFRELYDAIHDYTQAVNTLNIDRAQGRASNGLAALVDFNGTTLDLARLIYEEYLRINQSCDLSYIGSHGDIRRLSFLEAQDRVYRMSFDPYHCIERRWGAQGDELRSCQDQGNEAQWYELEQRLRNQHERTYDQVMGFDLAGLAAHLPGTGVDTALEIDGRKILEPLLLK